MRLDTEQITVSRAGQGSYVNGRYVPATPVEEVTEGNIQPLNGIELQQLPEGDRQRGVHKIYTAYALENGDIVTRADGSRHEVQAVENWTGFSLAHYKARLVRVLEQ